jgi:CRISPR/Cas system CSM-associated protein Csm2 small subunit
LDLAIVNAAGIPTGLTKVEAVEIGPNEATLRLRAGASSALLILSAERQYVTVKPEKDAAGLELRAPFRYAVLPDFFADDVVFDPCHYKTEQIAVPAENFLFGFMDGGRALVMCVWSGNLQTNKKEVEAKNASDEPKVELAVSGEGQARRFQSARIEFLDKPIHVAVLCRENYWKDVAVGDWEGQRPMKIDWSPPFEAKWRVNSLCKEGERSQDFYTAAQSRVFFEHGKPGPIKWTGEKPTGVRWSEDWPGEVPLTCQQGLWPYFIHTAWIDKKKDVWLALYADRNKRDFKAYQSKVRGEEKAAKKEGREYVAEPYKIANIYERVIIYPLDRTETTPGDDFTPVDVMRNTLGQGPCEYVLDLEGLKGNRHHGGDVKMRFETATCGIRDKVINPIMQEVKKLNEGEKLEDAKKQDLLHGMNDMLQFVKAVHQRLREYSDFNQAALKLCGEAKNNERAKVAAEQVEPLLTEMRKQLDRLMERANKELEKWEKTMPELVKKVEADDYKAAGGAAVICSFAESQDAMMAQSRRFARGVRSLAATMEAAKPDAQRFIEHLRGMCQKVMRRPHPMEGGGGTE